MAKRQGQQSNFLGECINEGIKHLKGNDVVASGNYIKRYCLNQDAIQNKYNELLKNLEGKKDLDKQRAIQYFATELIKYVANGNALNERGQAVLNGKGLEGKAKEGSAGNIFSKIKEYLTGNKPQEKKEYGEFTSHLMAFADGGSYLKTWGPELGKALLRYDATNKTEGLVRNLRYEGQLSGEEYSKKVSQIKTIREKYSPEVKVGLDKMIERIAAGVFGFFGLGFIIMSNMKLTAGVIGVEENNPTAIVSGILIIIALLFAMKSMKKKQKVKKAKKKRTK